MEKFLEQINEFSAIKGNSIESIWMTTNEAAQYLRITPGSLRNLVWQGLIPFHKFGRCNRYLREELNACMNRGKASYPR